MLGTAHEVPPSGLNPKSVQFALNTGTHKLVPFPAGLPLFINNYRQILGNPKYAHNERGWPYARIVPVIKTGQRSPPRKAAEPEPIGPEALPPPPPPKNSPPKAQMETNEQRKKREAREANAEFRLKEEARKQAAWNKQRREGYLAESKRNEQKFRNLKVSNLNAKMSNINNGMSKIEKQYSKWQALLDKHAWFFTKKRFEPIKQEVARLRKVHANAKWALRQIKHWKANSSNTAYRHGIRHLGNFEKSHANIKLKSSNVTKTFQYYFRELPGLIAKWEANEQKIKNAKERAEARALHKQAANAYLNKLNKEHENKMKAAMKIQAVFRGIKNRRNFAVKKAAATKIQAVFRGAKNRRNVAAATRIQAAVRGQQARKRLPMRKITKEVVTMHRALAEKMLPRIERLLERPREPPLNQEAIRRAVENARRQRQSVLVYARQ